jgi:hypothetical protein
MKRTALANHADPYAIAATPPFGFNAAARADATPDPVDLPSSGASRMLKRASRLTFSRGVHWPLPQKKPGSPSEISVCRLATVRHQAAGGRPADGLALSCESLDGTALWTPSVISIEPSDRLR